MSRPALSKGRVKEKDKSTPRDQSFTGPSGTRESKVDQIFESPGEDYERGGEFSADDEQPDPDEEIYQRIQREKKNKPSSSKAQLSQDRSRQGKGVPRSGKIDDGDGRIKQADKKVTQTPQQEQIFTRAFKYQLGIVSVLVLLSLVAHAFLFGYLYRDVHVSESHNSKHKDLNSVIDIKVSEAIEKMLNKAGIDKKVKDALSSANFGDEVKRRINDELTDFDINDQLEAQATNLIDSKADIIVRTKLDEVDINKKVQEALHNPNIDDDVKAKIKKQLADIDIDEKVRLSLESQAKGVMLKETDNPQLIDNVESKVSEKVKGNIENLFNKALQEVQEKINQFSNWLDNNKELLPDKKEYVEIKLSIKELSDKYSQLLQESIKEEKENLKKMEGEFEKLQKNISEAMKQYEEHKKRIDEIRKELAVIQPNTFNKENFMMAFMILTVIVCLLAVAVFNIYQRSNSTGLNNTDRQTPTRPQRINMDAKEILRKIPRNPVLKPDVCLISYDEARNPAHKKLLDSANVPECNIISHVIRMHEDILHLPKCKVYLMCTEFSERHVIIEEPGLGLGDLHRTTYDAVLQLGGCLIILYTRDPGSRRLKNNALYNINIYCVTKQKELSVLEKDNCFFSTYDELTVHQKTELRKKIVEKMK